MALDFSKLTDRQQKIIALLGFSKPDMWFSRLDLRSAKGLEKQGWLERNTEYNGYNVAYRLTPAGRAAYEDYNNTQTWQMLADADPTIRELLTPAADANAPQPWNADGFDHTQWAWQPFGPGETIYTFMARGSHYRGFPVINIVGDDKRDIESGKPFRFTYKGQDYIAENGKVEPVPSRGSVVEAEQPPALEARMDVHKAIAQLRNLPGEDVIMHMTREERKALGVVLDAAAQLVASQEREATLRAALEPFAERGNLVNSGYLDSDPFTGLTWGHLTDAADALARVAASKEAK